MDWLLLDPAHLHTLLAQTPPAQPPTPNSSELDLLRKQLDFLTSENARLTADFTKRLELITQSNKDLSDSFKTFVDTMKFVLVIFGFLGGAIAFIFGKNLDDAKKVARDAIRQEVDSHVTTLVQTEIENVKRTLQRERVIRNTIVHYYLPNSPQRPNEFKLLQARGFRDVRFPKDLRQLQSSVGKQTPEDLLNVVILDLENWLTPTQQSFSTLINPDRDTQAKSQIDPLLDILSSSTVLVVYVRATVNYLYTLSHDRYITPANNPITLLGMVADAAYVAAGDRAL
ncbi:hypothetical protein H6F89_29245 [Cyanobacteria bacterium FACHB-63]|nr:hypothetical protein [Cyanobacteria bacterium FACHB-63]